MALDSRTAAEVAREHGLTLSDAQALAFLADTREEANELAARFSPNNTPEALADAVYRQQGRP